ncbi:PilZ domain-containing protein [Bacillus sp. FSL K6-6540]|uniref:PilZ domain-containing protein n=1 Tax=Bacillus sp. FSL K6-6540 TaxID=2921512 RepID=UPI0030F85AF4
MYPMVKKDFVQKREFFRVPFKGKITLSKTTDLDEIVEFNVDDISGGGLSFWNTTHMKFEVDQLVFGHIYLPDVKIRFHARIARITGIRVSISFMGMHEQDRSKIVAFCLKRQLQFKK